MAEGVCAAIADEFETLQKGRNPLILRFVYCMGNFLLGLPMVTEVSSFKTNRNPSLIEVTEVSSLIVLYITLRINYFLNQKLKSYLDMHYILRHKASIRVRVMLGVL